MTAPDLALAETDPAGFVLAVADLREELIRGPHLPPEIAAWHAAEVAHWQGVAGRHRVEWHEDERGESHDRHVCPGCWRQNEWTEEFEPADAPCVELTEVVAAAKAYLAGAA